LCGGLDNFKFGLPSSFITIEDIRCGKSILGARFMVRSVVVGATTAIAASHEAVNDGALGLFGPLSDGKLQPREMPLYGTSI
jgi:hypothetical protein